MVKHPQLEEMGRCRNRRFYPILAAAARGDRRTVPGSAIVAAADR